MQDARLDAWPVAPGQHQCPRAEQHQAAGAPGTDHRVAPIEARVRRACLGAQVCDKWHRPRAIAAKDGLFARTDHRIERHRAFPVATEQDLVVRGSRDCARRPDLARRTIVLCAAAGTTGAMTAPIRIATVIVVIVDLRIPYSFPMTA